MENSNYKQGQDNWQERENEGPTFPIRESHEPGYKQYAYDDREDDDLEDEDDRDQDDREDDNDDDDASGDWGTVDPLEHPGPPSDMDPSAPGSAV